MADADARARLAEEVAPIDPAFAERLRGEESPEAATALVRDWADGYGAREPYWPYFRFSTEASHALEDGVEALAVETEAAFVAYAERLVDLEEGPEAHQAALERIRDLKRDEGLAATVARVEGFARASGLRVRHAGFTRALERCVPNPNFTVDYRKPHRENAGETAVAGALLGTAMMPIIGTAIGGAAGWLGGHFLHGKTPEASLEAQKAWIVQAGAHVRSAIEAAAGDVSGLASAQVLYGGTAPTSDEEWKMLTLYNAVRKFLPQGEG